MDWKTIIAAVAFVALVLFQAKLNEEHSTSNPEKSKISSAKTTHNQASLPSAKKH